MHVICIHIVHSGIDRASHGDNFDTKIAMETAFVFAKILVVEQGLCAPWRLALVVRIFGLVLSFTFGAFGVTFYGLRQA